MRTRIHAYTRTPKLLIYCFTLFYTKRLHRIFIYKVLFAGLVIKNQTPISIFTLVSKK